MIRNAVEADLESIVRIYNASIPGRLATADTIPVTVESRRGWLLDRDFAKYPLWVLERDARVAGWLSFSRFYGRPAYAATAEVSVYVDPVAQRTGVASDLMLTAIVRAPELGLRTFVGFVFDHNKRSVLLCRKFGFEQWGHLPRVAILDGIERDILILGKHL